jgi:hypothetical protein
VKIETTQPAQMKDDEDFTLTPPAAYSPEEESLALAIVKEAAVPRDLYPLVCVTFKMTLGKKAKMQRECERWELAYSDILRLTAERMVAVLESPQGELLDALVAHRDAEIARRKAQKEREAEVERRRIERHRKRFSVSRVAASA